MKNLILSKDRSIYMQMPGLFFPSLKCFYTRLDMLVLQIISDNDKINTYSIQVVYMRGYMA